MFHLMTPKAHVLAKRQLAEAQRSALEHRASSESHMAAAKEEEVRATMYEERVERLRAFLAENPDSQPWPRAGTSLASGRP